MSLVVPCTGCPAKLSAPESAAGKQIRCPKCKAVVTVPALVPAEEVPVVDAKVTAPPPAPAAAPKPKTDTTIVCCVVCNTMVAVLAKVKVVHCPKCGFANPAPGRLVEPEEGDEDDRPRKKRRRDDEDDERDERPRKKRRRPVYDGDDDEEDDRPRRRRRKPAGSGGGGRVVFMVCGVLLLFGLCGGGLYLLFSKGGGFAKKPPPAGWKEYSYPQSGFKAHFPSEPSVFGANVQGGFGGGVMPGGIEVPQLESMHSYTAGGGFAGRGGGPIVSVEVNRYSTPIPRASRDLMTRNGNNRFAGGNVKRVRWLGGDAAEVETGGSVLRLLVLEKVVVLAQITGPNGVRPTPEEVDGFFDNFELTK